MVSKKQPPPPPQSVLQIVDLAAGCKLVLKREAISERTYNVRWYIRDARGIWTVISDKTAHVLTLAAANHLLDEGPGTGRRVDTPEGPGTIVDEDRERYRVRMDRKPSSVKDAYHEIMIDKKKCSFDD